MLLVVGCLFVACRVLNRIDCLYFINPRTGVRVGKRQKNQYLHYQTAFLSLCSLEAIKVLYFPSRKGVGCAEIISELFNNLYSGLIG